MANVSRTPTRSDPEATGRASTRAPPTPTPAEARSNSGIPCADNPNWHRTTLRADRWVAGDQRSMARRMCAASGSPIRPQAPEQAGRTALGTRPRCRCESRT
eukprot:scaffold9726_cov119-Isochrysis_galbana.AAC.27